MTEAPRFLRPVTTPSADVGMAVTFDVPLKLDCGRELAPFTVAYVKEARKHPNADRLQVCDVVTRSGLVQVVCGAPNAKTGMKAIFAPPAPIFGTSSIHSSEPCVRQRPSASRTQ